MDIKDTLMIENTLDLFGMIEGFTDKQRLALVLAAISTLDEEGTIEKIRRHVNDPRYDD